MKRPLSSVHPMACHCDKCDPPRILPIGQIVREFVLYGIPAVALFFFIIGVDWC